MVDGKLEWGSSLAKSEESIYGICIFYYMVGSRHNRHISCWFELRIDVVLILNVVFVF